MYTSLKLYTHCKICLILFFQTFGFHLIIAITKHLKKCHHKCKVVLTVHFKLVHQNQLAWMYGWYRHLDYMGIYNITKSYHFCAPIISNHYAMKKTILISEKKMNKNFQSCKIEEWKKIYYLTWLCSNVMIFVIKHCTALYISY